MPLTCFVLCLTTTPAYQAALGAQLVEHVVGFNDKNGCPGYLIFACILPIIYTFNSGVCTDKFYSL